MKQLLSIFIAWHLLTQSSLTLTANTEQDRLIALYIEDGSFLPSIFIQGLSTFSFHFYVAASSLVLGGLLTIYQIFRTNLLPYSAQQSSLASTLCFYHLSSKETFK